MESSSVSGIVSFSDMAEELVVSSSVVLSFGIVSMALGGSMSIL